MDDEEESELFTREELMTASRYSSLIRWSDADQVYIADIPELLGARTHGDTVTQAAEMAHEVPAAWIAMHRKHGGDIPEPLLFDSPED